MQYIELEQHGQPITLETIPHYQATSACQNHAVGHQDPEFTEFLQARKGRVKGSFYHVSVGKEGQALHNTHTGGAT